MDVAPCTFPSSKDDDGSKRKQHRNPVQDQKNRLLLSQLILSTQQSNPHSNSGSQSPTEAPLTPPSPLSDSGHQVSDMLAKISTLLRSQPIQDFRHQSQPPPSMAPIQQAAACQDAEEQQAGGGSNRIDEHRSDGVKSEGKKRARSKG